MRKKITFNPELIKEEAKRFKLLTEYSFYHEENVMAPSGTPEKPIILGNELEEAEEEAKAGDDQEAQGFDQAAGMEDQTPAETGAEEIPAPEGGEEEALDFGQEGAPEGGEEMPAEEPMPEPEAPLEDPMAVPEAPAEEDIEVDVTSLVKGAKDAKKAAIKAMKVSRNTGEELMGKLSDLEARLAKMDSVANKIEDLEKEIVKRNPTPVEKLEMRSLSSFPYNIKLSDYWSEKEGPYDVNNKEEEYVLTDDDVDSDFSYSKIRDTFDEPNEEQGYEEEDI